MSQSHKAVEGMVVITNNQTTGKGQRGNNWEATPDENLTFSIILKPAFLTITKQFDLNVVVSLGILDFLKAITPGFQVKWPNDIYYRDKKIGGILINNFLKQHQIETSIIGIGLNVNQQKFATDGATSLQIISNKRFNLQDTLENLCFHIECRYLELRAGQQSRLRNTYIENMYWFGEDHIFKAEETFLGRIIGISSEGLVEIETKKGIKNFNMQEISFIG